MFTYIKIAFAFLPVLRQAILFAEAVMPGVGRGEEKLILVREFIEDAIAIEFDELTIEKVWPFLERFVARIVSKYNDRGWPESE